MPSGSIKAHPILNHTLIRKILQLTKNFDWQLSLSPGKKSSVKHGNIRLKAPDKRIFILRGGGELHSPFPVF